MSMNNNQRIKSQRRLAIILVAIISPILLLTLHSWSWLIEFLRPDDYSYGSKFYLTIIVISLLFNMLIIKFVFSPSSTKEKIQLWLKASFIAFVVTLGLVLSFTLFYVIAFSSGGWNFG